MKKLLSIFAILGFCFAVKAQTWPTFPLPTFKALPEPPFLTTTYGTTQGPSGQYHFYDRYDAPFLNTGAPPNRFRVLSIYEPDIFIPGLYTLPFPASPPIIKLGNDSVCFQCEALTYKFKPDIEQPILIVNFAVVFEDPSHPYADQPRFILRVLDEQTGELIEDCAIYDVTSWEGMPDFLRWNSECNWYDGVDDHGVHTSPVHWKPWTEMSVDLSKYAGKDVLVQFINYDCNQGAHYSYMYITAKFAPNTLEVLSCSGGNVTLQAPDYYKSYRWQVGDEPVSQFGQTAVFSIEEVLNANRLITCWVTSDIGCECPLYGLVTTDHLTVKDEYLFDEICEFETYTQHGFNLPSQLGGGIKYYQITLIDPVLCEVYIRNLELTVFPAVYYYKEAICENEDYIDLEHGFEIIKPGVGTHRYTNEAGIDPATGCMRTNVLDLTVSVNFNGSNLLEGDLHPCTGELASYFIPGAESLTSYSWDIIPFNNVQIESGYYSPLLTVTFKEAIPTTITLSGANGCGSGNFPITVTPNQSYVTQLTDDVCEGNNYNNHGFNLGVQNELGMFIHENKFTSIAGCDSAVYLYLNVKPNPVVHIVASDTAICYPTTELSLMAVVGDDVFPDIPQCGSGYPSALLYNCNYTYKWTPGGATTGGITVTPPYGSSTYSVEVTSDIGCTTTVSQIVVSASNGNTPDIFDTICYGEPYDKYSLIDPVPIFTPGTHRITGILYIGGCTEWPCEEGCILWPWVNVTVLPEPKFEINGGDVCVGDVYDGYGFHLEFNGPGVYKDTVHFVTKWGCDSLVIRNFNVKPQKSTLIEARICQYDTYNENGFGYLGVQNYAGTFTHTQNLKATNLCDSTVTLVLTVDPAPVSIVNFGYTLGFAGTPSVFINQSIYMDENNIAKWEWFLDGATNSFATTKDAIIELTAGSHTITLVVTSIFGCEMQITKNITIGNCPTPNITSSAVPIIECGLTTTAEFTGTFSGADQLSVETNNSNGKKAKLTVTGNTFTITYTTTVANVGKTVEIILTAKDSANPTCPANQRHFYVTVKPKPKVRGKGECVEQAGQ